MALWKVRYARPDGEVEVHVLAAANREAAAERAARFAARRGASVLGDPEIVDATRGSP